MSRILHVIPAVAPRYGGPSAAAIGMCRALEAAGVSTVIATTDADGPGRLDVPIGALRDWRGVDTIFFRRTLGEGLKWSASLASWLRGHVRGFDAAHIHAVFSHSSIAAGQACRQAEVPYLVRPLGTLDPWSLARKRIRKQLMLRWGVRRLLSGAAAIHYTSAEEMRLAQAGFRQLPPGVVVPIGVDDAVFAGSGDEVRPAVVSSSPYVLSVSRLEAKKGLELLIRAFHLASAQGEAAAWRLVIAGDGDAAYVSELKDVAASGDARNRIQFAGWVAGEEKIRLFRAASLFALASHQENFGISIAEAMASAVPVIVTPGVNLAPSIAAAGAGWIVNPRVEEIGVQLRTAMTNPSELARRGRQARLLAEEFRWPKVAEALQGVYSRIVVESAPRPAA
jgi:glycosyltransferase involved in cell wall biosynthesis